MTLLLMQIKRAAGGGSIKLETKAPSLAVLQRPASPTRNSSLLCSVVSMVVSMIQLFVVVCC